MPLLALKGMTLPSRPDEEPFIKAYGPSGPVSDTHTKAFLPLWQKQQHTPAITYQRPPCAKMPPPSLQAGQFPWYAGGTGSAGTIIAFEVTFSTMLRRSGVSFET